MASFVDSHCIAVLLYRHRVGYLFYAQSLRELQLMECVVTNHCPVVLYLYLYGVLRGQPLQRRAAEPTVSRALVLCTVSS